MEQDIDTVDFFLALASDLMERQNSSFRTLRNVCALLKDIESLIPGETVYSKTMPISLCQLLQNQSQNAKVGDMTSQNERLVA